MNYWLLKTEPEVYSWADFEKDRQVVWDGVRNYQARNFMKEMSVGDKVLIYHSGKERSIKGIGELVKAHYPDPTTDDARWISVDLRPVEVFLTPISLEAVKEEKSLGGLLLLKQKRLSVMPLTEEEFKYICLMGENK